MDQRVRGQHDRCFKRFGNHFGSTAALQEIEILFITAAHDDRQLRHQHPHMFQHDLGRAGIGKGNDDHAGAVDTGCDQVFPAHGIAVNDVFPGGGGFPYPIRVQVEGHEIHPLLCHETAQILAAAAIAANQHVLFGSHRTGRQRGQGQGARQPFVGRKAQHQSITEQHNQRCQQHRQHQHGEDDLRRRCGSDRMFTDTGEQDKAELTPRAQPQPGAHGHAGLRANQPGKAENQGELRQHEGAQHQQHDGQMMQHQRKVEHHADGDEKKPQQHVAEGFDIFFHLMPKLGFRDQHAGDKRAQRH